MSPKAGRPIPKAAVSPEYGRLGWLCCASLLQHRRQQQPAMLKHQGVSQTNTKLSYRTQNQTKCLLAFEIHCEKTKFLIKPFVRQKR